MKPLSEQLTAVSRPRLVLARLNARFARLRERLSEKTELIQALTGKIRDLEVSRAFWRCKAETLQACENAELFVDTDMTQTTELSATTKKNALGTNASRQRTSEVGP
jgi:hypothetical protein